MQTNHNIAPLFVRRRLRRYIKGGDVSKYCIMGYFCLQTYWSAKRRWRIYRDFAEYSPKCS